MSDLRTQAKSSLTAVEPGGAERPIEKPLAAVLFVRPAGGASVSPASEPCIEFETPLIFDELEAALETSGFEGVDDLELPAAAASITPLVIEAPVIVVPPVAAKPLLEVRPPSTPIAVYEPMEFLDFDDEDEEAVPYAEDIREPEPEPEPPLLTELISIALPEAASPSVPRIVQTLTPVALPDLPPEFQAASLSTVRPRFFRGPNPTAPKPVIAQPEPPKPTAPKLEAKTEVKVVAPPTPKPAAVVTKPTPPVVRPASPPPPPNVVQRPAAAALIAAVAPVEAEPSVRQPEAPKPAVTPTEKDRRPAAKAAPVAPPPAPVRMRDRGNAVPVEEVVNAPASAPAPAKPKMVPIRKPEPAVTPAVAPAAAASHDIPMLGLEQPQKSPMAKFGMVAGILVVLAGGSYLTFSGGTSAAATSGSEDFISDTDSKMVIGGGGWTTTWGADSPVNKGKQISVYRPSMTMSDYRLEFRGQIERNALGWIFRAKDPKNYYVMKLETIKPGANPLVALVKYAVVNGKETTHTQVMLPFQVSLGTIYQVRLDVKGNKFVTHVQGTLIDYWTDDRIKQGGAGFYTDAGERSQIKSSQISYLK